MKDLRHRWLTISENQGTARCEVVCCAATGPNEITIVWRNAGKVNLGPLGFELKPYVVTTTLTTDPADGLIATQVDAFKVNGPVHAATHGREPWSRMLVGLARAHLP